MKNKKQFYKNNFAPAILVASFFLLILAGFLYSKPFKVLKEVVAVGGTSVGLVNLNLAGTTFTPGGVWKSDGTVGIGTTAPGEKLEVYGGNLKINSGVGIGTTSPATGFLKFDNQYDNSGNSTANKIVLYDDGSTWKAGLGISDNTFNLFSGGNFRFWTSHISEASPGTNVFTILGSSGNVGIGTTAPGAKLHVSSGDTSLALFGPNTSWGGKLYVGASPNQALAATAQVISTDGNLHLDPAPSKNMYLGYYQARDIYINPNGGNVGIGTASPTKTLTVNGNIVGTELYTNSWFRNQNALMGLYNEATTTHFYSHGTNGWTLTGGSTYPYLAFKDTYEGTVRGYLYSDANGFGLLHSAGDWAIRTAPGSNAIYMPGNVSIGTTSQSAKLHVNGTVVYTIPTTFSGAGQNAAWTTGFTTQAMNVSILSSSNIVSGVGIYAASDERVKKNIAPISQEIVDRFLTSAHPVNFNWKETDTYDSGFIAQDLIKEGLGYLVSGMPDDKLKEETNKNGITSPAGTRFVVNYNSIIPILTTGIQQQQAQIEDLKSQLETQQAQIDELRELINAK